MNSAEPTRAPEVRLLPVESIDPHPDNPRRIISDVEVQTLSNSLMRVNLLHPIHVQKRGKRFRIVSGERRFRAVKLLNWRRIPAFVHDLSDDAALAWMLEENFHRRNLSPVDAARACDLACKRLGKTREEAAALCGMKGGGSSVTNKLKMLELPPEWQARVHTLELPEQSGRLLVPFVRAGRLDVLRAVAAAMHSNPETWKDTRDFKIQLDSLVAALDAGKPDAERTGPEPPNLFFLRGERSILKPIAWKLASKVWTSSGRKVRVDVLAPVLWPNVDEIDGRLKSAINQANGAFESKRWPLHLGRRRDFVVFYDGAES